MANFDWIGTLINWAPVLLLIGVWFYFLRGMRSGPISKFQQECLDLTKKQVETLERIATALEKRNG